MTEPTVTENEGAEKVKVFVWDEPTRVFHWTLLALVVVAWATAEVDSTVLQNLHFAAGYGVLGLLVFRGIWGFVGTRYALFSDFVRPWSVVRDYSKRLLGLRPPHSVGHNPLGGWMVVLLLVVLAGIVISGLFGGESEPGHDKIVGPLAYLVSAGTAEAMIEIHETLFNILLGLVAIHVAGVIADIVLTRDNLVRAMITGFKSLPSGSAAAGAGPVPYVRAAAVIAAAAAMTWLVVSL